MGDVKLRILLKTRVTERRPTPDWVGAEDEHVRSHKANKTTCRTGETRFKTRMFGTEPTPASEHLMTGSCRAGRRRRPQQHKPELRLETSSCQKDDGEQTTTEREVISTLSKLCETITSVFVALICFWDRSIRQLRFFLCVSLDVEQLKPLRYNTVTGLINSEIKPCS